MNLDEFAFFNQQLAAMLRDGIPLEGALRQLSAGLAAGKLRTEITALETDLSQGTPLSDALARRELPDLYRRLLHIGAKSNDLPAALTLLADYYQRQHTLWTKLKGLLVYPVLILATSFLISLLMWWLGGRFVLPIWLDVVQDMFEGAQLPAATRLAVPLLMHGWIFPVLFAIPLAVAVWLMCSGALRAKFLDRLPAFREARLAQTALAAHLLLKGGIPFPETVGLLEALQPGERLRADLASWRVNLSRGVARFATVAAGGKFFPPLFIWLVDSARENLSAGFAQAAEIYEARATHRSEALMYAALPVAVMSVGLVVLLQAYLIGSLYLVFVSLVNGLG
jgi:type II secretory pathway component PulF